jgi:hypothetical protein
MSTLIQGDQLRSLVLGSTTVSKASGTLSAATFNMFTVSGGEVLVTSLYLKVTTSITTNGGTLALQTAPTTGDAVTVVAATDLGTTDSAAGSLIGVDGRIADPATSGATFTRVFVKGGPALMGLPVTTGVINLVGASSVNGAVTAYVNWVPLTNGALLVAS